MRITAAFEATTEQYRLASLRYDLSKLRAKCLVERVPHARRYRLLPQGYTICLVFLSSRDLAKAQLDAAPTDTLLQQRVTSLNAVVADACN